MPRRVTYQLRIVLRETKPPIWRRLLVPPSMHLDRLHTVIQVVMGWEDCHLHMFRKYRERYSIPSPWDDDWRAPGEPPDLDEREYRISQLFKREDDWDHLRIRLRRLVGAQGHATEDPPLRRRRPATRVH